MSAAPPDLSASLSGSLGAFSLAVDLVAPAQGVTALVGPSGSGKSTVLRALAGLERLAGEVRLGAQVWQSGDRFVPAHRRSVGYVFQHAALFAHLSVRGNLDYARRRSRASAAGLDETVALLGLEPLLARAPGRLSGGERQRVAVARALLARPRLLLLDEPLSGVDADARRALLPQLRQAFAALAAPVIYVSHDAAEVAEVTARVLRIEGGRMVEPAPSPGGDVLAGRSAADVRRLAEAAVRAGLD